MENIKKTYKNDKFNILTPTRKDKFESFDGLHFVSDIQDYFEYIFKKQ